MKKTHEISRIIFLIISLCLFLFNFSGCGIDSIILVDAPVNVINQPEYDSVDPTTNYFEFTTRESNANDISGTTFLGTEVYYKIYSDYSSMTTEKNSLNATASDSTLYVNAATKLIDTYSFKTLTASNHKSTLIPPSSEDKDQIVYIRLTDYYDRPAIILLGGENGTNLSGDDTVCIPRRNADEELSFNFGRTSQNATLNKVPVSDDADVKYSSNTTDGKWYVLMYAVSVVRDETFKKNYSNILYLGDVTIDANSENN